MDRLVSENNLSSSFQTTLAVGGALALVAGAVIHRHKDKLSSFLEENLVDEQMNRDIDWQKLTIPAQVRRKSFSKKNTQNSFRHRDVLKHEFQQVLVHGHYIPAANQPLMIGFLQHFMMGLKSAKILPINSVSFPWFIIIKSVCLLFRGWQMFRISCRSSIRISMGDIR
jgi:hypothetical protein